MGRTQTSAAILHSVFREETIGASKHVTSFVSACFCQKSYIISRNAMSLVWLTLVCYVLRILRMRKKSFERGIGHLLLGLQGIPREWFQLHFERLEYFYLILVAIFFLGQKSLGSFLLMIQPLNYTYVLVYNVLIIVHMFIWTILHFCWPQVVVDDGKSDRITIFDNTKSLSSQRAITEYRVIKTSSHGNIIVIFISCNYVEFYMWNRNEVLSSLHRLLCVNFYDIIHENAVL